MSMGIQSNVMFFRRLKGNRNAFAMLVLEPIWAIPFNLYMPFFTLYMSLLGCSPQQIGLITTVNLLCQLLISFFASPVTDRFGRNLTTMVMNLVSWTIPLLLWMIAQNFYFFLFAAIIQALNRVVNVSWTCLLVEDTDKGLLVPIFAWLTVAGLLAGLFSPIAAVLINRFEVVPTMRWLLGIAAACGTLMFVLRFLACKETAVGKVRRKQFKDEPFTKQMSGLYLTLGQVWRNSRVRFLFILTAIYNMALTIRVPFFALLITKSLGFANSAVGYFTLATSVVMLFIYLVVQPLLARLMPKLPLAFGLALLVAGSLALVPGFPSYGASLAMVILSVVLTAVGAAVAQPFIDGLGQACMNNDNRSNMTGILFILILLVTAPFGYIGGWLFNVNAKLPFLAASALYLLSLLLLIFFYRNDKERERQDAADPVT